MNQKVINAIKHGYENMTIKSYKKADVDFKDLNIVKYSDLKNTKITGLLKGCYYDENNELSLCFSKEFTHALVVASTGTGKTTSYVIPTIIAFANSKNPPSFVISDPKGELYKLTSGVLKHHGFRIVVYDINNFHVSNDDGCANSETWNNLMPIYRMYQSAFEIENQVEIVETPEGCRNKFMGQIYESQEKLDAQIRQKREIILDEVKHLAEDIVNELYSDKRTAHDMFWVEKGKDVFLAFLWGMLEDSRQETKNTNTKVKTPEITEETFNYNTLFKIFSILQRSTPDYGMFRRRNFTDYKYFTGRDIATSVAYQYAANSFLIEADVTRAGVLSHFDNLIEIYRNSIIRRITVTNSIDFDEFHQEPTAIFLKYEDQKDTHYRFLTLFIQDLYKHFIEYASKQPIQKLERPFFFLLDEFGSLPKIPSYENVISACRSRNIFFQLIIQSYAQLNNVYGEDISTIIRDNMNVHYFIGSNNFLTLRDFSEECGKFTRISPLSALSGKANTIENYQLETLPLVPISTLSKLNQGECYITEVNCGYVMLSMLTRSYQCKEFLQEMKKYPCEEYKSNVKPFDEKFEG